MRPTHSHHRHGLRLHPLALALLGAGGGIASAMAADTAEDGSRQIARTLDTVEVVEAAPQQAASPKFTAPLLDTPQTVSVIPNEVFNAQGARNLTEVLRNTPGISFNAGENGFATDSSNFSLRGFDTSGSIFIDGVRDSGNYARDVYNLEQVEVAKGPAADNGRGGLGGYVNLVSKTPQLGDFARGGLSFGTDASDAHNRVRGTLDLNQQLGDSTALRLNLLAQDGGVAGRKFAQQDNLGIAPSLAFGLGTETRFILSAQHFKQSGRPDWGVPGASVEDTFHYDPLAASAPRDAFYGLSSDFDDVNANSALARIEHDFSANLTLSNQTRWSQTERSAAYTLPTGYTPATGLASTQTQFFARENTSLSNLTNLSASFATGGVQHSLAAGLELTREDSDGQRFGTVNQPATQVLAPDYLRALQPRIAASELSRLEIDTAALYVYDTLKFGERWQLTGGLRGERYKVQVASKTASGAPQGPDGYEVSETTLSGKLGLVFKPTEHGSLYAAVGIATLPPGSWLSNPDLSRTGNNAFPGLVGQNNDAAKPQRAVNHELGVKWNFFEDRLSATAAVFRTERRSVAITGKEPGNAASATTLRGYGSQRVDGVELALSGRITEAWSVFGGAVFLDSERDHSAYLDQARCTADPGDYLAGATAADCAALTAGAGGSRGDALAFTPKRSANLWTTYTFANGVTLGAGMQHVGDSWAGRPDDADRIIPNGRWGQLPGYTIGNLMAAFPVSERLTLRVNVDNVTNEKYATSGNWGMSRVFLGPSRAYLLSADFRFW